MSSVQNPRNSRAMQARLNGSKSQGPVTQSGKQISSKNAIKHGLFSPQVVLRNESQSDFDALLATLTREHNPQSETEFQLVHQMAAATWRIHRIQRMETCLLEGWMELNRKEFDANSADDAPDDDIEGHRIADAWRDLMGDDRFDKLAQHEARFQRQFTRALNALLKLQRTRKQAEQEPSHVGHACSVRGACSSATEKRSTSLSKEASTASPEPETKNSQNEPKKTHPKVYPIRKINTERTR